MQVRHFSAFLTIMLCVAMSLTAIYSQDKPATKSDLTLSIQEKYTIRTSQVEFESARSATLAARLALRDAEDNENAARVKLNNNLDGLLAAHSVKRETHAVCNGPGISPCKDVPKGDIQLKLKEKQ